jgi:hypothetical protein
MGKNVHVTHRADRKWATITEGSRRADSLHDTQQKAIKRGREIARANDSELFIHGRDNRFRDRDSHGHDPFPPRG